MTPEKPKTAAPKKMLAFPLTPELDAVLSKISAEETKRNFGVEVSRAQIARNLLIKALNLTLPSV